MLEVRTTHSWVPVQFREHNDVRRRQVESGVRSVDAQDGDAHLRVCLKTRREARSVLGRGSTIDTNEADLLKNKLLTCTSGIETI